MLKPKQIFFLAIFMIFLCNISAQSDKSSKTESKKEKFTFGPKISINFSKNHGLAATEYLAGADFGLFFRFTPSRLFIQPEINYQIRRTEVGLWDLNQNFMKIVTHHLDIPVLVGVKAINSKAFKLRLFVGPEFIVGLKDDNLAKHNFQLGFQTGLGVDIWRFTIDASYSLLDYIHPKGPFCHIFKVGVGFKCY